MKKIWITGAEGHIGTALLDLLEGVEYQLLPTDIEEDVFSSGYVRLPDAAYHEAVFRCS